MIDVPFLPEARAELISAAEHYEGEGAGLEEEFLANVERAVERIAAFPEHGLVDVILKNLRSAGVQ